MEQQFSAGSFAFGFLIFQCFLTLAWSIVTYIVYKYKLKRVSPWVSTDSERHPRFIPIQSLYLWGMLTFVIWFACGLTLGLRNSG